MEIDLSKDFLSELVNLLLPISISNDFQNESLKSILFEIDENNVSASATDSLITSKIVTTIKDNDNIRLADGVESKFTVDSNKLKSIIRESDDNYITFKIDDKTFKVVIECDNIKYKVMYSPSVQEVVGQLNRIEKSFEMSLKGKEFYRALEKTVFAADKKDNRYGLSNLLITEDSDDPLQIIFAATDFKRMCLLKNECEIFKSDSAIEDKQKLYLMVPRKLFESIQKITILKDFEDDISIFSNINRMTISFYYEKSSYYLSGQLSTTKLPAGITSEKVLPKAFNLIVKYHTNDLLKTLKRLKIGACSSLITMSFDKDKTFFDSKKRADNDKDKDKEKSESFVETKAEIDSLVIEQTEEIVFPFTFSCNLNFLSDVVKNSDYESIELCFVDNSSNVVVRFCDNGIYGLAPVE